MDKQKQKPNIAIRLADELEDYLREQAKAGYRTITAEVAMRLERTRQQDLAPSMTTSAKKEQPQ